MKHAIKFFVFMVILGLGSASAQLDRFIPPRVPNLWQANKADTLYIGASFTRSSFEPVKVWLIGNEAGWTGNLYFIDPTTKQEKFLFQNHDVPNRVVVLSDLYDIPIGDTVYFVYRVQQTSAGPPAANAESLQPKYTGTNVPGSSQFVSQAASAAYGHRWSVAGRVNDSLVIFGFEDNTKTTGTGMLSDMDFDDIVFGTTLSLTLDEVQAAITFTDAAGKPLPSGSFWSPSNDKIYISYSDDYASGKISKTVSIKVKNRKGAAPGDSESVIVKTLTRNAATGIWQAVIPVREFPGGVPGNGTVETYYIGEVTASVKSHNRLGLPDGNSVTANLNIAFPDKAETVKIQNCSDPALDITRLTTCISVQVTDQSPTNLAKPDTLYAEIKCDGSGDVIGKVALIEQPDGTFKSSNIIKDEGTANAGDANLSCKSTDNITVTYIDEIYGNRVTAKAGFTGDAAEDFYFANNNDLNTKITTIKDGTAPTFTAVVKTSTPTVGVVDQIPVTLTSTQGETEIFMAVETGPNTGIFTVQVPFGFATTPPVADQKITGFLDPTKAIVSVTIKGTATVPGTNKTFSSDIAIQPALNIVKNAYIKDLDGNGRGDHVYLVFSRPVELLPTDLTPTYWNQVGPDFDNTLKPVLTILPGFPNVVVADFSADQFPKGLTSVPTGALPTATLPSDNIFGGQKPVIADSMGPVLDSAFIKPFDNRTLVNGAKVLGVDTLTVYVSEALKSKTDWQDLIRFSKPVNGKCTDPAVYATSLPVVPSEQARESTDRKSFTILIASDKGATPLKGDCVFINVGGVYTDLVGNLPPVYGVPLGGRRPARQIEMLRGYPPVAGVNPENPGFVLANNDNQTDKGSEFSTKVGAIYQTQWIPPFGFVQGPVYSAGTPPPPGGLNTLSTGTEAQTWTPMPTNIGAVQVISTAEYIAYISIFDNMGNFMRSMTQSFGYHGELTNQERAANRGLASFLVWDLKTSTGQMAGQGVYVWKVIFQFKTGKQEIRYTRTGVTRNITMH